jgi:methyl-accepting chemotaxis protein
MRQLADGHAAYRAGFERVAALKTQDAAIADRLEAMGAQLSDRLDTLMVAAAQDGNASAVTIGQAMLPYLTQIRLNANTFVSRGVARARVRTQMRLGQLERVFDELDQATRERPYRADVEQFKALSLQYGEVFERYAALRRQLDELIGGELLQAGTTMAQAAEAIDNSAREAQQLIEQETTALLGSMSFVVLALSVGSAVVGLLLAWFVGRGLSRSVIGLTGVMGRLAEGDHSVEIPGTGRRDELGVMAKAVLVFKESMIRVQELADREQAERAQHQARARAIDSLAAQFDQEARQAMSKVASAADEMRATASSMTAAAEQTRAQSTAVAVASEQASANVHTVASAADQLSASIAEISRRVTHSAQIAGEAVAHAERTDLQVQGLTEAAKKISDVVQLITDIAGQTNLLALNATIEAARAGESGKGFAVVASEVKNLANETAGATEQIAGQIAAVQQATQEAVAAIQSIGGTIDEISEITTMIAAAIEQQGAATREIARNVQQASAGTSEVSSNIAGVSRAVASTGQAADQVLSVAGVLSQQSQMLQGKIETFLAGIKAA